MKTIKLNWGTGIAATYLGFVVMILVLVFMSTREKIDLVTSQYYVEELKFQDKIDQIKRANQLSDPLTWEVAEDDIYIHYPSSLTPESLTGWVSFYCPSNDKNDRKFKINTSNNTQIIPVLEIPEGRYHLQVAWESGHQKYWKEGVVVIDHSSRPGSNDGLY